MDQVRLLPISAIAELLYCPRNFYYRMLENATDTNHHLLEGTMQDELRNTRRTQRRGNILQTRQVLLSSEYYGITGMLDIVEEQNGDRYPVEYKKGLLRIAVNHDVQLCCQALLLEEHFRVTVPKGYIYYVESAERREVPITQDLRDLTLETIDLARRLLADGSIPSPVNDQRCNDCSLVSRCLPEEASFLQGKTGKPKRIFPSASLDRILYIDTPGAYLRKRHGCIHVSKDQETLREIPLTAIDQVVMVGQVNATSPLLEELMQRGIPTFFCSYSGKLTGWLQPTWGKNSLLRIAQLRAYEDPDKKLALAKQFVKGKLHNQRVLLMRYNRSLKQTEIKKSIDQLALYIKNIEHQKDMNSLLGIEGIGSRAYFESFGHMLKQPEFYFAGRNRRPPRDPLNVLLSFGYTLLTKDILSEIMRVGLDPYIGYLHSPVYGRPALALDILEEFRPVIVDSAALTAVNTGMVVVDDFTMLDGNCQLNEKARKAFLQAYRNRMTDEVAHPVFGYTLSYRRVIELQVRLLAKVIQGELDHYIHFFIR